MYTPVVSKVNLVNEPGGYLYAMRNYVCVRRVWNLIIVLRCFIVLPDKEYDTCEDVHGIYHPLTSIFPKHIIYKSYAYLNIRVHYTPNIRTFNLREDLPSPLLHNLILVICTFFAVKILIFENLASASEYHRMS
ncbi:unnamed protein product [Phytomonas sp. EM1]|nr:unnamed protein product [Phytomonas sp. EM1]|eukprot:CCW64313.1 unnamed protein product [Phytomonas sp. isolate EM1]